MCDFSKNISIINITAIENKWYIYEAAQGDDEALNGMKTH